MSHVYKVRIDGSLENGAAIVFAINLQEQSLEKLKEEIFVRKPDLKNQEIYIYYFDDEDDLISISNASDFVVFKESGFNRLYVAAVNNDLVEQSGNKPSVATLRAKSSAERYRTSSLEYSTGYCIGENTVDQDMPYKLRFAVGEKALYDNGKLLEEVQLLSWKIRDDGEVEYFLNNMDEIDEYGQWVCEDYLLKRNRVNLMIQKMTRIKCRFPKYVRDSKKSMPQTCHVYLYEQSDIVLMPYFSIRLQSFEKLMERIFVDQPNLKNREMRVYYHDIEGDRVIISNASDFEIFKESVCRDLFVRFGPVQQLHESPKPPIAAFREEEVVLPSVERTRSPLPVNLPSVQSASVNAPSKKYAHLFGTGTEKNSVRHGEKRASVQSILSKPMFTVGEKVLYEGAYPLKDVQLLKCKTGRDGKMMYFMSYIDEIEARGQWVREMYLVRYNKSSLQLKEAFDKICLPKNDFKTAEAKQQQAVQTKTSVTFPAPSKTAELLHFDQVMEEWARWNQHKTGLKNANDSAGISSTKVTAVHQSSSIGSPPIVTAKNARDHNRTFLHTGLAPTTSIFKFFEASKSPIAAEQAKASAAADVNKLPVMSRKNDVPMKEVDNAQPVASAKHVAATVFDDENTNVDVIGAGASTMIEKRKETASITAAAEQKSADAATDAFVNANKASMGSADPTDPIVPSDSSTLEENDDVSTLVRDLNETIISLATKLNSLEKVFEKKSPVKEHTTPSKVRSSEKALAMPIMEKTADVVLSKPTDEHVEEALASMIAMGFSNEGGWLTQLLETVKGDVSRAFDMINPQK